MANKYQRDLFDQFLALLPSASAALKTALREVAYCDLPAARKIVKYLKTHVEELRALDAKVVEHYEGNKEKLVAALDGVMVRVQIITDRPPSHTSVAGHHGLQAGP